MYVNLTREHINTLLMHFHSLFFWQITKHLEW